jgi:hypothetical protein
MGSKFVVAALASAAMAAGPACGQVRAHSVKAYVRQQGGITLTRTRVPDGEALIKIKNDSREPARMVLVKLDTAEAGRAGLPSGSGGVVPVGSEADLEYRGDGYRVVMKIDDLAPYYSRGQTSATMHVHLQQGRYVLFSNMPGDYRSGRRVELAVT